MMLQVIEMAMLLSAFFLGSSLSSQAVQSKNPELPLNTHVLRIGYPAGVLSRGVLEELRIAYQTWATNIAHRSSTQIEDVEVFVFDAYSEFLSALQSNNVDIMVLNTMDYIELEDLRYMEPFLVGFTDEKAGQEYVLLVRQDAGIGSIRQLENAAIIIDEEIIGRMPHFWLDVLLWEAGIQDKHAFFRQIDTVNKTSQAVLPVFFGNASACVTNLRAFRTISELNPQLGRQMAILKVSPAFIRGLFVFRKDLEPEIKKEIISVLQTIHEDPDGQQLLMLLKETRFTAFRPEYLAAARKLYEDYLKIQRARAKGNWEK